MPGHDLQWLAESVHASQPSARIYKRQDHAPPASGKHTDFGSLQAPRNLLFVPAHGARLGTLKSLCKAALKQRDCDIPTTVRPCNRCQACSKQGTQIWCAFCNAYKSFLLRDTRIYQQAGGSNTFIGAHPAA
jgi:hypothetical protein